MRVNLEQICAHRMKNLSDEALDTAKDRQVDHTSTNYNPTSMSDDLGPDSWELAITYLKSCKDFPSSFTSVIRLLVSDYDKNPSGITDFGKFFVGRLLRSPSIKAPYFYASKLFRPSIIGDKSTPLSTLTLIREYNGYEHASLLSLIVIFRLMKQECEPDTFSLIVPRLSRCSSLGWFIGDAIPDIGAAHGMVAATFRVLGLLPLLRYDPVGFKEYWSYLHSEKKQLDPEYELHRWGCNSLQLGVLLCQKLGLGLKRALPLMNALTVPTTLATTSNEEEQRFRATEIWLETLINRRSTPIIPMPPKFYPNPTALTNLVKRSVETMLGQDHFWLTRARDSIGPDKTPQLYFEEENLDLNSEPKPPRLRSLIPKEMQETLSNEAINELSNKLVYDVVGDEELP